MGKPRSLKNISLTAGPRQIVAILGSNGAGKTTLLKTLTGLLAPRSGRIIFEDASLEGPPPIRLSARGSPAFPRGGNCSVP